MIPKYEVREVKGGYSVWCIDFAQWAGAVWKHKKDAQDYCDRLNGKKVSK